MTRLSALHPYPAMIADKLAETLSARFVYEKSRVLVPFCGTARTLMAAAERGAYVVGVDSNPIAVMISRAKLAGIKIDRLVEFVRDIRVYSNDPVLHLQPGRRAVWFSDRVTRELSSLILRINEAYSLRHLTTREMFLIGAVLSATVREVSFCRKDQWKIHRIKIADRRRVRRNAAEALIRRLKSALVELRCVDGALPRGRVIRGDARHLTKILTEAGEATQFDCAITSPPYGDSFTTVQYGGMSSLALGVLQHVSGLRLPYETGASLDRQCLGGTPRNKVDELVHVQAYWAGGAVNRLRWKVASFLSDMAMACKHLSQTVRPGGHIILVVARRKVGGFRVRLDSFVIDHLKTHHCRLIDATERSIARKVTPRAVDAYGHSVDGSARRVVTMRVEHVLVFQRCK